MDSYGVMKISSLVISLVYFYILNNPEITADKLYENWKKSKIFRDYNRPDINTVKLWFADIYEELAEKGIQVNK